jgi:hypothetical protein
VIRGESNDEEDSDSEGEPVVKTRNQRKRVIGDPEFASDDE